MFEGTNFIFRIFYFLTMMLPAYILYIMKIFDQQKENVLNNKIIYLIISGFLISVIISYILNIMIKNSSGYQKEITIEQIISKNGDILSFLLGTVISSVITFESIVLSIVSFIFIQIIIYQLMIKSSTIFPNIVMTLFFKMNIYKVTTQKKTSKNSAVENTLYLINFSNETIQKGNIQRIGDSNKSNIYYFKRGEEWLWIYKIYLSEFLNTVD